jgi:glutaminyl-peptide cyclotransferase
MRCVTIALYACLLIAGLVFLSCDGQSNRNGSNEDKNVKLATAPLFNPDSAYFFVEKQVSFGPRVPNTQAHQACGNYLIETLRGYGAVVNIQEFVAEAFDGTKLNSRNIIATFYPRAPRRILLAAHWDSRPFTDQDEDKANDRQPIDGANDGASGVGVLLEIARLLSSDTASNVQVGVDILLFDSEDYGTPEFAKAKDEKQYYCLGSQYWANNKHKSDYMAYYGILLDMVGARDAKFAKEGTSVRYAGGIVDKVWELASKLGYGQQFIDYQSPSITDDHVYVNEVAKIPMIDIIEHKPGSDRFFGEYWHTSQDNMGIIDRNTLKVVGQTLLQTLYQERAELLVP